MQTRIKKVILLSGLIFILLVSIAYSTKILGFSELRFDGALIINSTTLGIKTSDIVRMFVDSNGNVGIKTSSPNFLLDVAGQINASAVNVTGTVQATTFIGDGSSLTGLTTGHPWNSSGSNVFLNDSTSFVGIGTATPDNLLTIAGNEITTNAILHLNTSDNFNTSVINAITLDHILKSPVNSTGGVGISILFRATDNISQLEEVANISAILYNATNGSELSALTFSTRAADIGDGAGHLTERLRIDGYGRVGINTSTPTKALHVIGDGNISGILHAGSLNVTGTVQATTFIGDGSSLTGISSATPPWNSSGGNVYLNDSTGSAGIGTSSPNYKLDVAGTVNASGLHIDGNANVTGTIFYGGNLTGYGADFAEMMLSDESLQGGDVVCFVDAMRVKKCNRDADKSVAGVVSSNPTIIGNSKNGGYPIGIVGLVKTNVFGHVDKFDLLTSSTRAGYAKKASKNDFGAILGKSLEACEEEKCIVNVLVSIS